MENLENILVQSRIPWDFLKKHPEWNNNKEVVLMTVQQDYMALRFASDELKNDKDIALAAIQKNYLALNYISDELLGNKELAIAAIQLDGNALQYFYNKLENDADLLFSFWNHKDWEIRLRVANHPKFIHTKEQIEIGIKDSKTNSVYKKRKLYWESVKEDFIPTIEQIEIGLNHQELDVRELYRLRQDEWVAKIEESKLMANCKF